MPVNSLLLKDSICPQSSTEIEVIMTSPNSFTCPTNWMGGVRRFVVGFWPSLIDGVINLDDLIEDVKQVRLNVYLSLIIFHGEFCVYFFIFSHHSR